MFSNASLCIERDRLHIELDHVRSEWVQFEEQANNVLHRQREQLEQAENDSQFAVHKAEQAKQQAAVAAQLVGSLHDALAAHLVRAGLTVPVTTDQATNIQRMLELLEVHRTDQGHQQAAAAAQLVGSLHDALAAHLVRAGLTVPVTTDQATNIQRMLELLEVHRTEATPLLDLMSDALLQPLSSRHPSGTLAPVQLSESVHVARFLSKQPKW